MNREFMIEDWMTCDVHLTEPLRTRESIDVGISERRDRLQARQLERVESYVDDLRDFLGDGAERLVSRSVKFTEADYIVAQRALIALLPGWTLRRETAYNSYQPHRPMMIERKAVKVGPRAYDYAIAEGRQFWIGPQGERLVAEFDYSEDKKEAYSEMTFFVAREHHDLLDDVLSRLHPWVDANHHMRGQRFNAIGEFIECKELTRWDDVFIAAKTRDMIERNCIGLLKQSVLFRANHVPLRRGIILHGPPGTGKTLIGQALAQHCGVTFILATPGMLEGGEDVRRVFNWGRRFAPSILFFEDFDMVARNRYSGSRTELVGEFLTCLDGIDSAEGVITIATTNDLSAIEPAIRDRPNRFDCILEIPPMARPERLALLARLEERHGTGFDVAKLADRTDGYTGAQMQEICRLAVFEAIHEQIENGNGSETQLLPLTDEHFNRGFARQPKKPKRTVGFQSRRKADDEDDD